MISSPPEPRFTPGTRVRVVQHVRVGAHSWKTQIVGAVDQEGLRPIGGMEMGTKALYCHQPTLRLRRDDGEITEIAVDENTVIEPLPNTAP